VDFPPAIPSVTPTVALKMLLSQNQPNLLNNTNLNTKFSEELLQQLSNKPITSQPGILVQVSNRQIAFVPALCESAGAGCSAGGKSSPQRKSKKKTGGNSDSGSPAKTQNKR